MSLDLTSEELRARMDRFEKAIVVAENSNDSAFAGQLRLNVVRLQERLTEREGQ